MKKSLLLAAAAAVLLVLPASQIAWGKAHVPLGLVQVCTSNGKIKVIDEKKLTKELAKGACRWTTCAPGGVSNGGFFDFVLQKKDACDNLDTSPADGFCDDVAGGALAATVQCTPVF